MSDGMFEGANGFGEFIERGFSIPLVLFEIRKMELRGLGKYLAGKFRKKKERVKFEENCVGNCVGKKLVCID